MIDWFFCNQANPFKTREYAEFKAKINKLEFEEVRVREVLEHSKQIWTFADLALTTAYERSDKMLTAVMLVIGWIFTTVKRRDGADFMWYITVSCVLASFIILILGRTRLVRHIPMTFEDFNHRMHQTLRDTADWQFTQARQYAIAEFCTQYQTRLQQYRLTMAASFLIAGLIVLAWRGL